MLCVNRTKGHDGDVWKSNRPPEREPKRQRRGQCLVLNESDRREIHLLKSIWLPWLPTRRTLDSLQAACSDVKSQLAQRVTGLDLVVRNPALTESCLQRALLRKKRLELGNRVTGRRGSIWREPKAAGLACCRGEQYSRKVGRQSGNSMSHDDDDDMAGGKGCFFSETLRTGKELAKTVGLVERTGTGMSQQRQEEIMLPLRVSKGSLGLERSELGCCEQEDMDASPEVGKYNSKIPNWFLDLCASGLHLELESSLPEECAAQSQELRDLALQPRVLHIQSLPHGDIGGGGWLREDYFIVTEQRFDSRMNPVFLQKHGDPLDSSEASENDFPANRGVTSRNNNTNESLEQSVKDVGTNMAVGETRRGEALQVKDKPMRSNTCKSQGKQRKANKEMPTFSSSMAVAAADFKGRSFNDESVNRSLQGHRSPSRFSSSLLMRTMARIKAKLQDFNNSRRRPKQEACIGDDAMPRTGREKGISSNDGRHWQSRRSFALVEVQANGYQTRRKLNSFQDKNNSSSHFQDSTYVEYADDRLMVTSNHRTLQQADNKTPSRSYTNWLAREKSWKVGTRSFPYPRLKESRYDSLTSEAWLDSVAKQCDFEDTSERGFSMQPGLFQELRLRIHEFVRAEWGKAVRLFLDREENALRPRGAQNWAADAHVQKLAPYDDRRDIGPTVTIGKRCSTAHRERSRVADLLSSLRSSDVSEDEAYQGYQALTTYTKDMMDYEREQLMGDMKQGSGTFKVCGENETEGTGLLVPRIMTLYRVEEEGKTCSYLPTQGPSEGCSAHEDPCNGRGCHPSFRAVHQDFSNEAKDFTKDSISEASSFNKLDKESTKLAKLWTQLKSLTDTTVEEIRSDEQISPAALGCSTLRHPSCQDASVSAWSRTSSRIYCPCHGPHCNELNANASNKPSTTKKKKSAVTKLTVKVRGGENSAKRCTTDRGTQYVPFSDRSAHFMPDTPFNSSVSDHGQSAGILGKIEPPDAIKQEHENPNPRMANGQATVSYNGHFPRGLGQTQHPLNLNAPPQSTPAFNSPNQNTSVFNAPNQKTQMFYPPNQNISTFDESNRGSLSSSARTGQLHHSSHSQPLLARSWSTATAVPRRQSLTYHASPTSNLASTHYKDSLALGHRRYHGFATNASRRETDECRSETVAGHQKAGFGAAMSYIPWKKRVEFGHTTVIRDSDSHSHDRVRSSEMSPENYRHPSRTSGHVSYLMENPRTPRINDMRKAGSLPRRGSSKACSRKTDVRLCKSLDALRGCQLPAKIEDKASSFHFNKADAFTPERLMQFQLQVLSCINQILSTGLSQSARHGGSCSETCLEAPRSALPLSAGCARSQLGDGQLPGAAKGDNTSVTSHARQAHRENVRIGGMSTNASLGNGEIHDIGRDGCKASLWRDEEQDMRRRPDGGKASVWRDEQQDTRRGYGCRASVWRDEEQFTGHRDRRKTPLGRDGQQIEERRDGCKASLWRDEHRPNATTRVHTVEAGMQTEDYHHSKGSQHDAGTTKLGLRAPVMTHTGIESETSHLSWGVVNSSVGRSEDGNLPAHGAFPCQLTGDEHVGKRSNWSNATQTPRSESVRRRSHVNKKCQVGRSKVKSTGGTNVHYGSLKEKCISPGKQNIGIFADRRNERRDAVEDQCQRPHTGTIEICDDPSVELNEALEVKHGGRLSKAPIIQKRRRKSHGLIRHSNFQGKSRSHYNTQLQEHVGSVSTTSDSNDTVDCVKSNTITVKGKGKGQRENCPDLRVTYYPNDDKIKMDRCKPLLSLDASTPRASPIVHIRYRVRRDSNGPPSEPDENVGMKRKEVGANLESRLAKVIERSLCLQKEILRLQEQRRDKPKVGNGNKRDNDDGPASVKVLDVIYSSSETSSNDNINSNAKTSDNIEDERAPTKSNPVSELDARCNIPARRHANASHGKGHRKDAVLLEAPVFSEKSYEIRGFKFNPPAADCSTADIENGKDLRYNSRDNISCLERKEIIAMTTFTNFEKAGPDLNNHNSDSKGNAQQLNNREGQTNTTNSTKERGMRALQYASQPRPGRLEMHHVLEGPSRRFQNRKGRPKSKTHNVTMGNPCRKGGQSASRLERSAKPDVRDDLKYNNPIARDRTRQGNGCIESGYWQARWYMDSVGMAKTFLSEDGNRIGHQKGGLYDNTTRSRSRYSESNVRESLFNMKEMRTSDKEDAHVRRKQVLEVLGCKRLRKRGCVEENKKCPQNDQAKTERLKWSNAGQTCPSLPFSVMDVWIQRKSALPADRALRNSNSCHTFSKHSPEQENWGSYSSNSKSSTHVVEDLPYDSDSHSTCEIPLKPGWLLSDATKFGRVADDHEFLSRRRHSEIPIRSDPNLAGNEHVLNRLRRPLGLKLGNAVEGTEPSGMDQIDKGLPCHEGRKVTSLPFTCGIHGKRTKTANTRERPCTDMTGSVDLARPLVEAQADATLTGSIDISSLSRTDSSLTTQTVNISSLTTSDTEGQCGKRHEWDHTSSATNSPVNDFLAGVRRGDGFEESDDLTWSYPETDGNRCPSPCKRMCNDDVESLQISLDSTKIIDIPDGLSILQENNSKSETIQGRELNDSSVCCESPKLENIKEDDVSLVRRSSCGSGFFATKPGSPKSTSREEFERAGHLETNKTVSGVNFKDKPRRLPKRVQPRTIPKSLVGTCDSERLGSFLLLGLGHVIQANADRVALEGFFCHDLAAKCSTQDGNNVRQFGVVIHNAATPSEHQTTVVYGTYRRQVEAAGKRFTWRFKSDGQVVV